MPCWIQISLHAGLARADCSKVAAAQVRPSPASVPVLLTRHTAAWADAPAVSSSMQPMAATVRRAVKVVPVAAIERWCVMANIPN